MISGTGYFNPRPPRGGRPSREPIPALLVIFQSTPPARGATKPPIVHFSVPAFQSTPPARGGDMILPSQKYREYISIHAPREGGDATWGSLSEFFSLFQSTPPARGATVGIL